jgi:hypothetical protein
MGLEFGFDKENSTHVPVGDGGSCPTWEWTPRRSSMRFILQPWQLVLTILAGWMQEQQQQVIAYLRAENRDLGSKPVEVRRTH